MISPTTFLESVFISPTDTPFGDITVPSLNPPAQPETDEYLLARLEEAMEEQRLAETQLDTDLGVAHPNLEQVNVLLGGHRMQSGRCDSRR